MVLPRENIPTVMVIFGVTGDLMAKKITPALFHLHGKNRLPNLFSVIGVSRRPHSDEEFRAHITKLLQKHSDMAKEGRDIKPFLELFSYSQGQFEDKRTYEELARRVAAVDEKWGICSNKLFYLAVPPDLFKTILTSLASSGLTAPCGPDEGWTRVLVEKPFGRDLKTANELDELLGSLFREMQIYRIDHYLAKEMLQNVLSFRFSNALFEQSWNNQSIDSIRIRLLERMGVEDRGSFYDGLGCLRDVGQNHLLQMLALVTMDNPGRPDAAAIRSERARVLQTLKVPSPDEARRFSFRAQYEGYHGVKGVKPDSRTETYFKIKGFLQSPRWQGVPIIMESGKRIGEQTKEIAVVFKHPEPCLCPPGEEKHYQSEVVFGIEPKEGITIKFWSKKPGLNTGIHRQALDFLYREEKSGSQYVEEYEKLLLDCIVGDQTLFVSTEEVKAMWKFTDAYAKAWEGSAVPLHAYKPDTLDVLSASGAVDGAQLSEMKKEIGIIGLGRMGGNMALRLAEKGWRVVAYNRTEAVTREFEKEGISGAYSIPELVSRLSPPRVVWLMLTAGSPIDQTIEVLAKHLQKGDIVVDGGNSFYKDAIRRHEALAKAGITFVDVGVSGGPKGARSGACLMVGGDKGTYEHLQPLFLDFAVRNGVQFFEGAGAGHFVKMVHNGIEYGMMQAIAEGFAILKNSKYRLDLTRIADIYNHGSVIESRLVGWLKRALEVRGEDLKGVSGKVGHTGEGEWTVETANELGLKAKIIEGALQFRKESEKNPDTYTGKVLSALREQFGMHPVAGNGE